MKKRILFISNYPPATTGGQRFRFEQYIPLLQENGFECVQSTLLTPREAVLLYQRGHLMTKGLILIRGIFFRIRDLFRANQFDVIFIFREAFMVGPPVFEFLFKLFGKKIVFDLDDAIWLSNVSEANRFWRFLKFPEKANTIFKWADWVIAGNKYLGQHASKFNQNIKIFPTTVDDRLVTHRENQDFIDRPVCIGWSGSKTTVAHFRLILPALARVKKKYGGKVSFKLIGDETFESKELELQGTAWKLNTELVEMQTLDIGLMPLPADEWSKGKCGFKAIYYMALGIPAVISPVGVNLELLKDGESGYFCRNEEEWVETLSKLVESVELRQRVGKEGRKQFLDHYSYSAHCSEYLKFFNDICPSLDYRT